MIAFSFLISVGQNGITVYKFLLCVQCWFYAISQFKTVEGEHVQCCFNALDESAQGTGALCCLYHICHPQLELINPLSAVPSRQDVRLCHS